MKRVRDPCYACAEMHLRYHIYRVCARARLMLYSLLTRKAFYSKYVVAGNVQFLIIFKKLRFACQILLKSCSKVQTMH